MRRILGRLLWTAVALAGMASAAVVAPVRVAAQTIVMVTDTSLVLDSNKPDVQGPQAGYVAFRITGGSGQRGVTATLSGLPSNLIQLGGGQPASQVLGRLPADTTLYWYLQYPTTFGATATLTVTLSGGATGSGSGTVTTRKMNSSNSGGNTSGGLLGPGAVIGQVIWFETNYDFGGAKAGDVYNLQPSGLTTFDARCFQLIGSDVTASTVTAIPAGVGSHNRQFYAASVAQNGSGFTATLRWYFKYRCSAVSSYARPYASMQSGSSNLAYSGNYGAYVGPTFPAASNPFSGRITKTASRPSIWPAGTITYTVSIPNTPAPGATETWASAVDSIVDVLPAGAAFVGMAGGSVSDAPVIRAGGQQLIWYGPYPVAANATLQLMFTVTMPSPVGRYVNAAEGYVGSERVDTAAKAWVRVGLANVRAAKTGPAAAAPGDTLRYVLNLSNSGPTRADSVVLTDTLPATVTYVRATRAPTQAGRVLTWPMLDSLRVGQTITDTVVVVAPATLGTITNVVAATAVTLDTIPANNNGSAPDGRVPTTISVGIEVNPQGGSTILRLPGTRYSQAFTVANHSLAAGTYDVLSRRGGAPAILAIDSITGPGITSASRDSARVVLGAQSTTTYTVWYTVAVGDTAVNAEYLRARSVTPDTLVRSEGWVPVRRVFPKLTLGKAVTPASGVPGTELSYKLTVDNIGEYAARSVTVTDSVPAQVAFKLGSGAQTLPAGVTAVLAYSNATGPAWADYTPVSGGCSAPAGFDACVRRIRWTLQTDLAAAGSDASAEFRFIARIR